MRVLGICLVISVTILLSRGDCGCGAKCANYTGAAKCTRCCTTTVKRSVDTRTQRAYRFLLPISDDQIRTPMWLQPTPRRRPQALPDHRPHRIPTRSLLDRILVESIQSYT